MDALEEFLKSVLIILILVFFFIFGGCVGDVTSHPWNTYLVTTPDNNTRIVFADECQVVVGEAEIFLTCTDDEEVVFSDTILTFEEVEQP